MELFSLVMRYYPYVVHPITVLGVGILLVIRHEWSRQDAARAALWHRFGAFLGAGLLALLPTVTYFIVTERAVIRATKEGGWAMDGLVAVGVLIAAGVTWFLWRRFEWGGLVPGGMQALAAVTLPYLALSPFWDVSGHVIYALMPTLYLTLLDRRYWPTLLVPAVMVPNRLYLGAHTVPQALGGLVIAAGVVLGLFWWRTGGSFSPDRASTS
jgi:membrane-associated phospholipid phosphatase